MLIIICVVGYFLVGAVFSGVTNKYDMWGKDDFFAPLLFWPILSAVFIVAGFFIPFMMIAERIAKKNPQC